MVAEHNEKMLGLWNNSQKAMLGLEAQAGFVRPKVLYLKEED